MTTLQASRQQQDMFGSLVDSVLYTTSRSSSSSPHNSLTAGATASSSETGSTTTTTATQATSLVGEEERLRLFFVTYRQFGTSADLLKALQDSFRASTRHDPSATKKRIGEFLLRWLENCPEDFVAEKKLGEDMLAFARAHLSSSVTNHLKLNYVRANTRGPAVEVGVTATVRMPFETTRSRDIACYFTLLDWRHFVAIKASELFDMAWRKPNKAEAAPHVTSLTQRFNTISLWLADLAVESYGRSAHTAVVEKIVEVLKELFKLNNFSSGMAVMSALHNASVQRLRGLWRGVRKEHRDCFLHFELFMSPKDNFKNYRRHLAKLADANKRNQTKTSAIPFLALFLKDLTFIHDGNADTTEDHQLNLEKLELQGRQLLQLQEWQKNPFTLHGFVCDQAYLSFFDHLEALSEDDVFAKSLRVQPTLADSSPAIKTKIRRSYEEDSLSLDGSVGIDLAHHRLNPELWAGDDDTDDTLSVGEVEADMSELSDFKSDNSSRRRSGSQRKKTTKRDSASSPTTSTTLGDSGVVPVLASDDVIPGHSTGECPVLGWKVHEVADWMRRAFLSQHISAFANARIDGQMLLHIDHKFLTALGISSFKERKTVLMRIDTLKQEHGLLSEKGKVTSQVATPRQNSEASGSVAAAAVGSESTTEPSQERVVTVRPCVVKVCDEHDQQVIEESNINIVSIRMNAEHRAQSCSDLSRLSVEGASSSSSSSPSSSTPRSADVSALGGASVLICCDDDKWDYGRLGPISYDRLLQAVLDRYDDVFSEASQVAIACADIRKGGMKIRSDKDLRKLKLRVSERQAKIVVLSVTKRNKRKKANTLTAMMTMTTKTRL